MFQLGSEGLQKCFWDPNPAFSRGLRNRIFKMKSENVFSGWVKYDFPKLYFGIAYDNDDGLL